MPYAVSPWPNWRRPWPWRDVTSFTCREPRFSSRHWINAHVHLFLFSICYNAVPRPARSHPQINLSQSHCDLHNFSHTFDRSILTEFINQSGLVYARLSQDHLDWSIWLGCVSNVWLILSRSQERDYSSCHFAPASPYLGPSIVLTAEISRSNMWGEDKGCGPITIDRRRRLFI